MGSGQSSNAKDADAPSDNAENAELWFDIKKVTEDYGISDIASMKKKTGSNTTGLVNDIFKLNYSFGKNDDLFKTVINRLDNVIIAICHIYIKELYPRHDAYLSLYRKMQESKIPNDTDTNNKNKATLMITENVKTFLPSVKDIPIKITEGELIANLTEMSVTSGENSYLQFKKVMDPSKIVECYLLQVLIMKMAAIFVNGLSSFEPLVYNEVLSYTMNEINSLLKVKSSDGREETLKTDIFKFVVEYLNNRLDLTILDLENQIRTTLFKSFYESKTYFSCMEESRSVFKLFYIPSTYTNLKQYYDESLKSKRIMDAYCSPQLNELQDQIKKYTEKRSSGNDQKQTQKQGQGQPQRQQQQQQRQPQRPPQRRQPGGATSGANKKTDYKKQKSILF